MAISTGKWSSIIPSSNPVRPPCLGHREPGALRQSANGTWGGASRRGAIHAYRKRHRLRQRVGCEFERERADYDLCEPGTVDCGRSCRQDRLARDGFDIRQQSSSRRWDIQCRLPGGY
jgi:hypothetical protein